MCLSQRFEPLPSLILLLINYHSDPSHYLDSTGALLSSYFDEHVIVHTERHPIQVQREVTKPGKASNLGTKKKQR